MAKKKKSAHRKESTKSQAPKPANKPPKWGLLVAAVLAFLLVNVALTVMNKLGVDNRTLQTVVVIVIAILAGLGARPLTFALQKRFSSNNND